MIDQNLLNSSDVYTNQDKLEVLKIYRFNC